MYEIENIMVSKHLLEGVDRKRVKMKENYEFIPFNLDQLIGNSSDEYADLEEWFHQCVL